MFLSAKVSMYLSLTLTKRSLELNASVTDLFTSFGYSGINSTKGVISQKEILRRAKEQAEELWRGVTER